jgi:hypothetical protein
MAWHKTVGYGYKWQEQLLNACLIHNKLTGCNSVILACAADCSNSKLACSAGCNNVTAALQQRKHCCVLLLL